MNGHIKIFDLAPVLSIPSRLSARWLSPRWKWNLAGNSPVVDYTSGNPRAQVQHPRSLLNFNKSYTFFPLFPGEKWSKPFGCRHWTGWHIGTRFSQAHSAVLHHGSSSRLTKRASFWMILNKFSFLLFSHWTWNYVFHFSFFLPYLKVSPEHLLWDIESLDVICILI